MNFCPYRTTVRGYSIRAMALHPQAFPTGTSVIDQLLREQPQIWRGNGTATVPSVATGFVGLDRLLLGRGWSIGALTEIVPA